MSKSKKSFQILSSKFPILIPLCQNIFYAAELKFSHNSWESYPQTIHSDGKYVVFPGCGEQGFAIVEISNQTNTRCCITFVDHNSSNDQFRQVLGDALRTSFSSLRHESRNLGFWPLPGHKNGYHHPFCDSEQNCWELWSAGAGSRETLFGDAVYKELVIGAINIFPTPDFSRR